MPRYTARIFLGLLALVSALLGGWGLHAGLFPENGLPTPETLVFVEGRLSSAYCMKYSIDFELQGVAGEFSYPSKAGAMGEVCDALENAEGRLVRAGVVEGSDTRTVFSLELDGAPVATYEEVAQGWRSDNRVGWLLAAFFLPAAVWFLAIGFGSNRRRSR